MKPLEPREWTPWAILPICAGVVTLLLGCLASTVSEPSGLGLGSIVAGVLAANGLLLIGCGRKCARLGAALEEQAKQIRILAERLAALDRPESDDPDTRIKPAP